MKTDFIILYHYYLKMITNYYHYHFLILIIDLFQMFYFQTKFFSFQFIFQILSLVVYAIV